MSAEILTYVLVATGWLLYWLKKLVDVQVAAAGKPFINYYFADNWMEMCTSLFSCAALLLLGFAATPVDQATKIADFTLGYSAGSILNSLITNLKPESITPVKP